MNTSTTPLVPLAMSQTKEDLLRHVNMSPEIYALMAKEAGRVYKWLTSDTQHLKKHCKRKPPYDWSDILEKSKDEAMERISNGGDQHTSYYWNLAKPTEDCPNWIARWFLYHKFRYRDGRNRNAARGESSRSSGKSGHKQHSTPVSSSSQSARSGGYSEDQRSSRYQARTFEGNDREHDGSTSTYSYYPQSQPCLQGHSQSQGRMAYQSPSSAFSHGRGAGRSGLAYTYPAVVSNTSSIPSYSAYAPSNVGYSQKASSVATSSSTYYEDEYCEIDDNTSETSSKPYYDPVRDV